MAIGVLEGSGVFGGSVDGEGEGAVEGESVGLVDFLGIGAGDEVRVGAGVDVGVGEGDREGEGVEDDTPLLLPLELEAKIVQFPPSGLRPKEIFTPGSEL